MAKNPERHTTGDESIHAKDSVEPQLSALTLYVTDIDTDTCDRWGTPADCPQGRVTKVSGFYMTAEAPTSQHPCPSEPEAYLTIRSANQNFFNLSQIQIGTVVTVAMTFAKPSMAKLKEGEAIPPRRVKGVT